jgi:allantoate deiminase/N-carbamoyl-L-amino-acid hydrolase
VIILEALNSAEPEDFVKALDGIYEHSPWVAERTAAARPFANRFELLDALNGAMLAAPHELQLSLVCAHPELAGKAAIRGELTAHSTREQAGAGLSNCSSEEYARLQALNAAYLERFGFPFILAVKGHDRASILLAFEQRLANGTETEFATALHQIGRIAAFRLADRIEENPGDEILAMCARLAQHSEQDDGLTCTYLTAVHRATAAQLRDWMLEAGLDARIDAVGNVVGRLRGSRQDDATVLLTGSHYDTVINGGKFDGRLGIVLPIVVAKRLRQAGTTLPFDLEIVGFSEEEGVRYKSTFLGSSAITGRFDLALLDRIDAKGIAMREAIRAAGHDPESIGTLARDPSTLLGFVEVHIEQGPVLLAANEPLGIVTAINGSLRYLVSVTGLAGHAGTVPMNLRRDAAAAAAEIVLLVEQQAGSVPGLVGTVGRLEVPGGAVNVIPGRCELSIDIRAPQDSIRDEAAREIVAGIAAIAAKRGVDITHREIVRADATACAPGLQAALAAAIGRVTGTAPIPHLPSGAGHDAMQMAKITDTAMLFVRCGNGGISHHPDETMTAADADLAARVFADFLEHLDPEPSHSPRRSGDGWLKAFSGLLNV